MVNGVVIYSSLAFGERETMRRDLQPMAMVTQVGLTMVVCILIGLAIGLWIDNTFGTKPCATLLLTLVGVSAGTYSVYRIVSEAIEAAAGYSPKSKEKPNKDEFEHEAKEDEE